VPFGSSFLEQQVHDHFSNAMSLHAEISGFDDAAPSDLLGGPLEKSFEFDTGPLQEPPQEEEPRLGWDRKRPAERTNVQR
jgi:hypothetical protein